MAFRVVVTGGRHFTDYPALRAALDALLANRLPDVELVTTGGRGVGGVLDLAAEPVVMAPKALARMAGRLFD